MPFDTDINVHEMLVVFACHVSLIRILLKSNARHCSIDRLLVKFTDKAVDVRADQRKQEEASGKRPEYYLYCPVLVE